ncbi:MAG: hypothetical protein R3C59_10915 [Planctomycetaceae bacterium]
MTIPEFCLTARPTSATRLVTRLRSRDGSTLPRTLQASFRIQIVLTGLTVFVALTAGQPAVASVGLIGLLLLMQIHRRLANRSAEWWRGAVTVTFLASILLGGLTIVIGSQSATYGLTGIVVCLLQTFHLMALTGRPARRFFMPPPAASNPEGCQQPRNRSSVRITFMEREFASTVSESISMTAGCLSSRISGQFDEIRPGAIGEAREPQAYAPFRLPRLGNCATVIAFLMFFTPTQPTFGQFGSLETTTDSDVAASGVIVDRDRTPDGAARLEELAGKAKRLCLEIERLQKERRPHDAKRATMLGPYQQAQAALAEANRIQSAAAQAITNLNRRLNIALSKNEANALRNSIRAAQLDGQRAEQKAAAAGQVISNLEPQIVAINRVIKPIDDQALDAFRQLEECRQQWFSITRPDVKYARGDYETLRQLLDTWLLTDGLWPDGMIWAGLCAYSLQDFPGAEDYTQKVEHIREKVFMLTDSDPKLLALKAMIARDRADTDSRKATIDARRWTNSAANDLRSMERSSRAKPEAIAYFILARFHAGRDSEHKRALKYYELSLQHDPEHLCSTAGLGSLQIESDMEGVRDPEQGVQRLQKVWDRCETKSWRLALQLINGYRTTGDSDRAEEIADFVLTSDDISTDRKAELKSQLGI